MIITEQVQVAVHEQNAELAPERMTRVGRLIQGPRDRNDHVAEMPALAVPEGENVCRPIDAAVAPIELPHAPIADERDTEGVHPFERLRPDESPRESQEGACGDAARPLQIDDLDLHHEPARAPLSSVVPRGLPNSNPG